MQGQPPAKATTVTGAVFLSYASEDAAAAERIAVALRAAGIEVWFDKSELRGGDAWDHKIRDQIHDCRLFVPVISANTERRDEGYFRREWSLAVDRTRDMAHKRVFLVPVAVDATPERGASVPEKFHELQWTRLPDGETPQAFVEQIRRLLTPEAPPTVATALMRAAGGPVTAPLVRQSPLPSATWIVAGVIALVCAYFVADKIWLSKYSAKHSPTAAPSAQKTAPNAGTLAAFNPPPHSIAVLPFVNMSGDKDQEYFSDGLSEELLNSLARINELQVAARTSSFYFKGEHADLATISHKLNVASVLEGSVRRAGHTLRVTAQLNNAATGFHLWSETYDRDLGDVLKLQSEIADAVASALKIRLLGDTADKVVMGGTRNPKAHDAYLRGLRLARIAESAEHCGAPVKAFSEAIGEDPNYALAYASRSLVRWDCATYFTTDWIQRAVGNSVRGDATRAIHLAPALAAGFVALSNLESGLLNFPAADQNCARALALEPANDQVIYYCSQLAGLFGRAELAISLAHRGVALDPLNPRSYAVLGDVLRFARRYREAIAAYQQSIAIDPEHADYAYAALGVSYHLAGDTKAGLAACQVKPEYERSLICEAIIYPRLGRQSDAAATLAAAVKNAGDAAAYQYVQIRTQWKDYAAALDWLEKAKRLGDPGLIYMRTDQLLDPIRDEPRFKAIERELKFPD